MARSYPKILIVAPNASARFGGEAILALHYFRILSRRGYPVKLVTHRRNAEELAALPGCDPAAIHFIPDTRWHRLFWSTFERFPDRVRDLVGGGVLNLLDGFHQSRLVRDLVKGGHVDLIHQPAPVSPLTPSDLHRFRVPLVIGPMNGGIDYPPGYEDYEGRGTQWTIGLGRRLAVALNLLVPGKHRAAALLVANARTQAALPDPRHPAVAMLVENGIDLSTWQAAASGQGEETAQEPAAPGRLRLAYVGRVVRWKALDITLHALVAARRKGVDATLDVLGDGEDMPRLAALAESLGLGAQVTFHGFQPQNTCAQVLARSDALVLNSLRECGGAAVLEAMAMGLPVVASEWGGPADYLTGECGLLVSPTPRASFADRLADAFAALARDPALRRRMGEAGRRIVREEYDWDAKVDRMLQVYQQVLSCSPVAVGDPARRDAPA